MLTNLHCLTSLNNLVELELLNSTLFLLLLPNLHYFTSLDNVIAQLLLSLMITILKCLTDLQYFISKLDEHEVSECNIM